MFISGDTDRKSLWVKTNIIPSFLDIETFPKNPRFMTKPWKKVNGPHLRFYFHHLVQPTCSTSAQSKGEWTEVLTDMYRLPLVAVCIGTGLKATKEPTVMGATWVQGEDERCGSDSEGSSESGSRVEAMTTRTGKRSDIRWTWEI